MSWLSRLFRRSVSPERAAGRVAEDAKRALGQDFVGLLAYGSWVAGEYVEGYSDLNLMVVTRKLDGESLRRLAPAASKWKAMGRVRSVVFSMTELKGYADSFPIEFLDIADNRKLIAGEDPFLRLQPGYGRLAEELETELRDRLAKLRHRFLQHGGDEAETKALLSATASSLFPLLRAFLRLKRRRPPRQRVRLIEEACRNFRFGRRTLLQLHDLCFGRRNAERIDTKGLFERAVQEIERMIQEVIRLRQDGSGSAEHSERLERSDSDRGERGDSERGDDRGRDRSDRDRSRRRGPGPGGDRSKRLTEVKQLVHEAGLRKKWEPKEPDRFVSDEFTRDLSLSPAARFGWDRGWQPERRARGYVAPVFETPSPVTEDEEEMFVTDQATAEAHEAAAPPEAESTSETQTEAGSSSGEVSDEGDESSHKVEVEVLDQTNSEPETRNP